MAVERLALSESRAGHFTILPQALISIDGSYLVLLVSGAPDIHKRGCKNSSRTEDA